jgi:hypothetical protein
MENCWISDNGEQVANVNLYGKLEQNPDGSSRFNVSFAVDVGGKLTARGFKLNVPTLVTGEDERSIEETVLDVLIDVFGDEWPTEEIVQAVDGWWQKLKTHEEPTDE